MNVLAKILAVKKQEIKFLNSQYDINQLIKQAQPNHLSFWNHLPRDQNNYILEFKHASPSAGILRQNFAIAKIANSYNSFASCVSVLTDRPFFNGSYENLALVRKLINLPILHKDFIIDPIQIYLGRINGSNALLLMLELLNDEIYIQLYETAKKLNLTVLTEISKLEHIERIKKLPHNLIGVNNRDFSDLTVSIDNGLNLAAKFELLLPDAKFVSESGIKSRLDIIKLTKYFNNFLIGSQLIASNDLNFEIRKIIFGLNKVCGLTRVEDAVNAELAGATHGGLIFHPSSARNVDFEVAKEICIATNLKMVGVFVNAPIDQVVVYAIQLNLAAVQLHGSETDEYIIQLKFQLNFRTKIWKAYTIDNHIPEFTNFADKILLDSNRKNKTEHNFVSFDWSLLKNLPKLDDIILAGGLTIENVHGAMNYPVYALDFNSGLELAPGIKDKQKIDQLFHILKNDISRSNKTT